MFRTDSYVTRKFSRKKGLRPFFSLKFFSRRTLQNSTSSPCFAKNYRFFATVLKWGEEKKKNRFFSHMGKKRFFFFSSPPWGFLTLRKKSHLRISCSGQPSFSFVPSVQAPRGQKKTAVPGTRHEITIYFHFFEPERGDQSRSCPGI